VKVTVHVEGGVFGDDTVTSVTDDEVTVRDAGELRVTRQLPASSVDRVRQLARQVADVTIVDQPAAKAIDGGTTTIAIDDEAHRRTIVLSAGDDPPNVVWDLLDAVEALHADEA
jgi:hypothetical protein